MVLENNDPWNRAVVRAIKDPAFKARLVADPVETLREAGVAVPDGVRIKVFENTQDEVHLVLPSNPIGGAITEAELERVAGGMEKHGVCTNLNSGCYGPGTQ